MKIHIDTSTAEEQAKAQKVKTPSTSKGKGTPAAKKQSGPSQQSGAGQPQQSQKPTRPLTKKPPNEPKAPSDVQDARQQQTTMLKARQQRETQGKTSGFQRDADVGAGFWPPVALW